MLDTGQTLIDNNVEGAAIRDTARRIKGRQR